MAAFVAAGRNFSYGPGFVNRFFIRQSSLLMGSAAKSKDRALGTSILDPVLSAAIFYRSS